MVSELRRMVVSATIQQSSMIKGAMLFDYVNSVHFMLQEKTLGGNDGLRVLVRIECDDTKRIYAYLAERYLSFWFKKYTKFKTSPWAFINHKI